MRSVEIFCTRKTGAESTSTRVGSSSPATNGSAGPLTLGSSLFASGTSSMRSWDWFVTYVPSAMTGASVTSNSTTISPDPGTVRLRMSSTPVPFAPPAAFVLLVSAPAGTVISVSVPGAKTAGAFRRSSSSNRVRFASGVAAEFWMRRR